MHDVSLFSPQFAIYYSSYKYELTYYLSMHGRRWWKDIHARSKLSFVRDRIVELYLWMNNACYYPTHSLSRIVLTKITAIVTILDDIFDTYGTSEECMQIAEAIYRYKPS
jgi:(S)-beta-macrocarpene synthase